MRIWTRLGVLVTAIGAAFVVTGAGYHHPVTSGPENVAAARAVAVITGIDDGDPAETIPPDFADVMGYEPAIIDGPHGRRLEKTGGNGCSSPLGATTYDFGAACRSHDLGYDLLRYAAEQGGELGPWARRAIDARLAADMTARCDELAAGAGCRTLASVSSWAVELNSWRQGQGVPGREDLAPYLVGAALVGAALIGPTLVARGQGAVRNRRTAAATAASAATAVAE